MFSYVHLFTGRGCSWWEGRELFYNQWASNHQHPTVPERVSQKRVQTQPHCESIQHCERAIEERV